MNTTTDLGFCFFLCVNLRVHDLIIYLYICEKNGEIICIHSVIASSLIDTVVVCTGYCIHLNTNW